MNENISSIEPVKQNGTIDYEEAMNMLLKSLEKSEVFQLRRHISKLGVLVLAVLLFMDLILTGYAISLHTDMEVLKGNYETMQQMLVNVTFPTVEEKVEEKEVENIQEEVTEIKEDLETSKEDAIAENYYKAMNELLSKQECTPEWFDEYMDTVNEYSSVMGSPDTVEDIFSSDDLTMMYSCVETEVHGGTFWGKVNVSNVIFNRLSSGQWGDSLTAVVTSPGQFACNKVVITEETKKAVAYAYMFPDTTHGAEYFNRATPNDPANSSLTFIFSDDVGHYFYKKSINYIIPIETTEEDDDAVG